MKKGINTLTVFMPYISEYSLAGRELRLGTHLRLFFSVLRSSLLHSVLGSLVHAG